MRLAFTAVHPDLCLFAKRGHDNIDLAVAIQVSQRAAAVARGPACTESGLFGISLPFAARARVPKDGVELIDNGPRHRSRDHVSASGEDVFPAIVIEVVESRSEC